MASVSRFLETCLLLYQVSAYQPASLKFITLISMFGGSALMILHSEVVTHIPTAPYHSISSAVELSYPQSLITRPIARPFISERAATQVNMCDFSHGKETLRPVRCRLYLERMIWCQDGRDPGCFYHAAVE